MTGATYAASQWNSVRHHLDPPGRARRPRPGSRADTSGAKYERCVEG